MTDPVLISIDGHIAQVILNRPEKHNAVSLDMFDALGDACEQLASNRSIRAVVLHGEGPNFCAGIDVDIFRQADLRYARPDAIRAMKRLVNSAWQMSEKDALALEAKLQLGVLGKENQLEAVMANVEKREPVFRD